MFEGMSHHIFRAQIPGKPLDVFGKLLQDVVKADSSSASRWKKIATAFSIDSFPSPSRTSARVLAVVLKRHSFV
jgi:hypothetical protein